MPRVGVSAGRLGKVGAEIGIEGVDEIMANVAKALTRASGMEAKRVFMKAALIAVREIKDLAPVKTGKLKSAIFADYGDPKKPNVLVGVNYKIAPHAHLVEYGHAGPQPAGPHPYFRPGVTSARSAMAASLITGMKKLIGGGDTTFSGPSASGPSFPTGGEFA